jgi:hypothetical protein
VTMRGTLPARESATAVHVLGMLSANTLCEAHSFIYSVTRKHTMRSSFIHSFTHVPAGFWVALGQLKLLQLPLGPYRLASVSFRPTKHCSKHRTRQQAQYVIEG